MKLPPIPNPGKYVGLYVYDFRTHVSVGYTALEIHHLRESEAYRHGTAYEIYRATEAGGLELRGALDDRLMAKEAMCFLRTDSSAARRDYNELRRLADGAPAPCAVELRLAHVRDFDPPCTTAMIYQASSGTAVAGWLGRGNFAGGDRVIGGVDVCSDLTAAGSVRIDSCSLPTMVDYTDRCAEEVFRTVHEPLQR